MLTTANFLISLAVITVCACRLRHLPRARGNGWRAYFSRAVLVLLLVSAFANGFRGPLFGTGVPNLWPLVGGLSILLAVLEGLIGWGHKRE